MKQSVRNVRPLTLSARSVIVLITVAILTACNSQPSPAAVNTKGSNTASLQVGDSQLVKLVEGQKGQANAQATLGSTYGPVPLFTATDATVSTTQSTDQSIITNGTADATAPSTVEVILTNTPVATTLPPTSTATMTFTPSPNPLPTLNKDMMGIQLYSGISEGTWAILLDRATFMGFKWIKFQISWKEVETAKGQYSAQLGNLKTDFLDAGRRGFKILVGIANTPDWARPANARGQADGPPTNPQDLADFAGAVIDQLGAQYLTAIEIWNEPNVVNQWTGAPLTAASYQRYFTAAYKAIRTRSSAITVITAGPAPSGDTNGSVDDRKWLQDLYSAGLPITDPNLAIGVHPYGWANPPDAQCCVSPSKGWDNQPSFFFLNTINDYRAIMLKNNHAQGRLWATEFGWSTFKGLHYKDHVKGSPAMPPTDPSLGWTNLITEDQQAQYTVRAFNLAQTGNLATFLGPMFLWNMNFSNLDGYVNDTKPSLPEAGFSVLDSDLAPRPVYNLMQAAPKK